MLDPFAGSNRIMHSALTAPLLTREQEVGLTRSWQNDGDTQARAQLIHCNMRYVVSTARSFARYGASVDDLIAEATLGLLRATDLFNPEFNVRFITYATHWIRASTISFVLRSWTLVSSGRRALQSRQFFRLRRELAKARALFGDPEQATAAVAESLGVSQELVASFEQQIESRDLSLDLPSHEGSSSSLLDNLDAQVDTARSYEHHQALCYVSPLLYAALATLTARERLVLQRRWLCQEQASLAEVGHELGVSRERARQLETRAKEKVRRFLLRADSHLAHSMSFAA